MKQTATLLGSILILIAMTAAKAAEPQLLAPRESYLTSESVAIVVPAPGEKTEKQTLRLLHEDGSLLSLEVPADPAVGGSRVVTLKPGALKPGAYKAWTGGEEVRENGLLQFQISPAEHANPYFTAQWRSGQRGRDISPEEPLAKGGWMYFNSDLIGAHPFMLPDDRPLHDAYVTASMHPYVLMVIGGGHQFDLRAINDWGDPWVQRGVIWRLHLAGLANRIYPRRGLHVFDEPGLTWWPILDDEGERRGANPFAIPHQLEEYEKLTGVEMPVGTFQETLPQYKPMLDEWIDFMDLRMKYLEQAWEATVWATESVHDAFDVINQVSSSYATGSTTDGVDSRQARPYDIVSAHGGYSDRMFGTFEPLLATEGARGFTRDRPQYYLPMWYTHTPASIRNAVWLSWVAKVEGMMYTPEQDFDLSNNNFDFNRAKTIFEIAEINRRLARVGGVMNELPKSHSPVAVLHSHRQFAHDLAEVNHPEVVEESAAYHSRHNQGAKQAFFRVMDAGIIPNWIDEHEAVTEGVEFLNQWPVIYCPGLSTAQPAFRELLEQYVENGGILLQYEKDDLVIPGAVRLPYQIGDPWDFAARYGRNTDREGEGRRDLFARQWLRELTPGFEDHLQEWLGDRPYTVANTDVLLGVHRADEAAYLLFANNAQSQENPRSVKHELIPVETEVALPTTGVVYDLLNGGEVEVQEGRASLRLAAGDGACWVHLPAAPGAPGVEAELVGERQVRVTVQWDGSGYLPFRLRLFDPEGRTAIDWYRATAPTNGVTRYEHTFPLGANAEPGEWRVQVDEWMTGGTAAADVSLPAVSTMEVATLESGPVSVFFDDAEKIRALFAGEALEPDYSKLNWDAERVMGLDARRFAVFGPDAAAEQLAEVLREKGMTVEINPPYTNPQRVEPKPGRGRAGPEFHQDSYETIEAHAIVLPGHELADEAIDRNHINYVPGEIFPGEGRTYVQWGISCFQAGWQNVFVFGDTDAGVEWLTAMFDDPTQPSEEHLVGRIKQSPAENGSMPGVLRVESSSEFYDTPVGVAFSPDGQRRFIALHDGSVAAYDAEGKLQWQSDELLEANAMALSPDGKRVAVAGYPGLSVLDAETGKQLGVYAAEPVSAVVMGRFATMRTLAWSDDSSLVAGGWILSGEATPEPLVVLDADGKLQYRAPEDNAQNVFGLAFVPGTHTLLVGGVKNLVALDVDGEKPLWENELTGARVFAFAPDEETVAVGCWSEIVARVRVSDGQVLQSAEVEGIVGGVAQLPSGEVVAAVWGGITPLMKLPALAEAGGEAPQTVEATPWFAGDFAFHDVRWLPSQQRILAMEQGGRLLLLDENAVPTAQLDDAGTTIDCVAIEDGQLMLGRMNRTVQVLPLQP